VKDSPWDSNTLPGARVRREAADLDPFAMIPERFQDALARGTINRRQFAIGAHLARRADRLSGWVRNVTTRELVEAAGEPRATLQTIRNDLRRLRELEFIAYESQQGKGEVDVLLTGLWLAHRPRPDCPENKKIGSENKKIAPENFVLTTKGAEAPPPVEPQPERAAAAAEEQSRESAPSKSLSEDYEEDLGELRATDPATTDRLLDALDRLSVKTGAANRNGRPPSVEQAPDGSLLWTGEAQQGEAGVLADLDALAAAGLGEWVEDEGPQ
jgi:hypothetical protein